VLLTGDGFTARCVFVRIYSNDGRYDLSLTSLIALASVGASRSEESGFAIYSTVIASICGILKRFAVSNNRRVSMQTLSMGESWHPVC
jgi:hypothetical protein